MGRGRKRSTDEVESASGSVDTATKKRERKKKVVPDMPLKYDESEYEDEQEIDVEEDGDEDRQIELLLEKDVFNQGLEPSHIVGATTWRNQVIFVIGWKDTDQQDIVRASEANIHCPQLVISFYEKRLILRPKGPVPVGM